MMQGSGQDHSLGGSNSERSSLTSALTEILQSHPFKEYRINDNDVTVWDRIGPYTLTFDMVFALGKKC